MRLNYSGVLAYLAVQGQHNDLDLFAGLQVIERAVLAIEAEKKQ